MNKTVLKIDLNEEYKVKIEEADKLGESFFSDIYKKAGLAVKSILEKSEKSSKKGDLFGRQKEEYNNIIAFCGGRGTGKSSGMITFAQSLVERKKSSKFYKNQFDEYLFHHLDVIDPSMFEESEDIFEVILSQLFSSFRDALNRNNDRNDQTRRAVLELFEEVYDNLKTVQKSDEKYNGQALETLSKLSCGVNLRNKFSELVQRYLAFICGGGSEKSCLVIPIDDFDLNVKSVAVMLEQIRKYLMIPNVVVLMAADMKLLADAKEQSVRKEFKTMLEVDSITESPKSIASKYILKLIPDQRQLFLPSILDSSTTIDLTLKIQVDSNKEDNRNNNEEKDDTLNEQKAEDLFLRFCYQNYGFLFLKPKTENHPLVPRNLREYIEWMLFLTNPEKEKATAIESFITRFIDSYCANNLESEQDYKIIQKLSDATSEEFHKRIIELVIAMFKGKTLSLKDESVHVIGSEESEFTKEFKEVINKGNHPFNISLGDILLFLSGIERYHNTSRFKKLVFAIKTLITHRMVKSSNDGAHDEFCSIIGGGYVNYKNISVLKDRQTFRFRYDDLGMLESNDADEQGIINKKLEYLHYFVFRLGDTKGYRGASQTAYHSTTYSFRNSFAHFDILAPLFYISKPSIPNKRSKFSTGKDEKDNLVEEPTKSPFISVELVDYIFKDFIDDPKLSQTRFSEIIRSPYNKINDRFKEVRKIANYINKEDFIGVTFSNKSLNTLIHGKLEELWFERYVMLRIYNNSKLDEKELSLSDFMREMDKLKSYIKNAKGNTLVKNIQTKSRVSDIIFENKEVANFIGKSEETNTINNNREAIKKASEKDMLALIKDQMKEDVNRFENTAISLIEFKLFFCHHLDKLEYSNKDSFFQFIATSKEVKVIDKREEILKEISELKINE